MELVEDSGSKSPATMLAQLTIERARQRGLHLRGDADQDLGA